MTRPAREVKKVRVNLDMHPDVKAEIEALRDRLGADSMGEVIRRSVQFVSKVIEAQDGGGTLLIKPKIGFAQQLMLF